MNVQNPHAAQTQLLMSAIENSGIVPQIAANNSASSTGPNGMQYAIKFIQHDQKNNIAYVNISPVNITNLHEPRIELRYQSKHPFVSIDERTPNNTVVAAVVVNDEDSGPSGETSLSIDHGNDLGHFKLVSTQFTNTIQVNGAPLSKHRVPEYNLTIVARDQGSPPKSSAVNLVIKLMTNPTQNVGAFNAPPEPPFKPPVTDFMFVGVMLVVIFFFLIVVLIIGCAVVQRPKGKKALPPRTTSATTIPRLQQPSDRSQYPPLFMTQHTNF